MLSQSPVVKELILARRNEPPSENTPAENENNNTPAKDASIPRVGASPHVAAVDTPARSVDLPAGPEAEVRGEVKRKVPRQRSGVAPRHGGSHADGDVDVPGEVKGLLRRLGLFALLLLGAVIDLAFIGVWIILHQWANHWFDQVGSLPRITHIDKQIMEIMFDGATLTLLAAYVVRDLYLSVRRLWRSW
jgi:hypothetical protein